MWRSPDLKTWTPLGLVWKIDDGTWQKEKHGENRALWAPEIHYVKSTFWLTMCMNFGGTGLLKSTSGKAEGPYVDVHPKGPLTANIDASLFADDDGKVYFVWQNGMIARLNDELTELAEKPRQLKPSNHDQVGFEGAFLTKINKQYYLVCAEFIQGDYPEVARAAIKEMHRQVGDLVLDAHGLARRGLLVRHLVMPGGLDETREILRFLSREVSPDTFVNVMPQYRPEGLASRYPALARPLKGSEFQAAVEIAGEEGLRRLARG